MFNRANNGTNPWGRCVLLHANDSLLLSRLACRYLCLQSRKCVTTLCARTWLQYKMHRAPNGSWTVDFTSSYLSFIHASYSKQDHMGSVAAPFSCQSLQADIQSL